MDSDGEKPYSTLSLREQRRFSIKKAKLQKRKEEIETSLMIVEDERSELENEAYRVRNCKRGLHVSSFGVVVVMYLLERHHTMKPCRTIAIDFDLS